MHRDVKLENVLISTLGSIKVADFGLACTITSQTATNTQGLLIGTVSYLPPELMTSGRAHSWSDIYSTGIVLFEMLTGTKPYTADAPITVAYKHVNEDVPKPSDVLAQLHPAQARREPIPDYLDALVLACTRRNPDVRPPDGRELLRRVRRVRKALERGVRSDDALVALVYPTSALPWHAATQTVPNRRRPNQPALPVPDRDDEDDRPTTTPPLAPGVPRLEASGATAAAPIAAEIRRPVQPAPPRQFVRPRSLPTPDDVDGPSVRFPQLSRSSVHRRRRGVVATVLVVLLALGIGIGSWWFTTGRYMAAPSVVNQSQAQAIAIAEANGLEISFTEQYSEIVPKDLIISSDPAPGERMLRGTSISAVISLGPERFAVPELAGHSLADAKAALAAVNLMAGTITEAFSESVPTGIVIEAGYPVGELLKRDSPVDLVVSKGRESLTIPNVTTMPLAQAQQVLTDTGFTVAVNDKREYHPAIPKDAVISQQPATGTGFRGDTITLVVSDGPEPVKMVKVPEIKKGDRLEAARDTLEKAGFEVEVIWESPVMPALGRVIEITDDQDKPLTKDSELPEGSTIKVYVSI